MTRKHSFSLILVLALVLSALGLTAAFAQDTSNPIATCDDTVQALVWAARDAYGYDVNAALAATSGAAGGGAAMDDMGDDAATEDEGDDAEATPEATEAASLSSFAKVPVAVQQDATEEPGDDAGEGDAASEGEGAAEAPAPVSVVNCDAIRADVIAFIFAANGMTMGGGMSDTATANQFFVDGEAITPNFHVLMSGPQEVPGPGDDDATGEGWFFIDGETNTVCWNVWVSGMNLPASAAHIHIGAEGESGPPVVPFTEPGAEGTTMGCTEAEPDVVQAILANPSGYYVNIHNADFPQGATRGQLLGL